MNNTTDTIETPGIFEALKTVLEKSEGNILPNRRQDFERQVLDIQVSLIEKLSYLTKTYCNGGWEDIKDDWRDLHNDSEISLARQQLLSPANLKEFDAAIRCLAGRGMEKELDLLQQVGETQPQFMEEDFPVANTPNIGRLIESAEQRIRERLSDPAYVMNSGEAAYQKNKAVWDKQYEGEFIAIHRGRVVAHDREQSQLARKLVDLQRREGRFRAYVVEVGAPPIVASGPHGGARRPVK